MDESITIKIEQLEELLENKEYAKEWKADRYFGLIKENMRLEQENKRLKEQLEYWDKQYISQDEKAEEYRNKYLKEKSKTKERQNKTQKKCFNCGRQGYHACKQEKKCYTCGKIGHKQKNCHKDHICEKCNRKGHTERV